ncbi:MAG: TrkH family potassium uptake protein [Verrucomicrobiota bacterium]
MNYKLIARLLSMIMLILTLAFGVCLAVSIWMDSGPSALIAREAFMASIATSLASALLLFWVGRNASFKFFRKEALAVIGLSWILASVIGAIPYIILTPHIGSSGAIFESASGITTTGASVLSDLESLPKSLLFWRALSQWIGGMGVVVFFVAILGFLGADAKILYANEASGSVADFEESRVQKTVLQLIYLYLGLSALCTLAYWIVGMGWFDATCHMFTTVSTAGFSTRTESMAAFDNPLIEWVCILFMLIAGVSFFLQLRIINGNAAYLKRNTEFYIYFGLFLIASAVVSINLILEGEFESWPHAIRAATFNVTSILTTTGYATEDFAAWSILPQSILICLMVIGGCSGSTSGGIKVFRTALALKMAAIAIERSFRTRIIRPIRINDRIVHDSTAHETMTFLVMNGMLFFAGVIILSSFEPALQVESSLSAVTSCMFNIGPGFFKVGPTETYAFFQPWSKLLLSLLMIMGRLELYAVLVLFSPTLWKRFR